MFYTVIVQSQLCKVTRQDSRPRLCISPTPINSLAKSISPTGRQNIDIFSSVLPKSHEKALSGDSGPHAMLVSSDSS